MSLTAIAFVVIFVFGLGMAFFRHPIWGLYTYLFTFYNHPDFRWWGVDLPHMRWSLIASVVTLVAVLYKKMHEPNSHSKDPWHSYWGVRILIMFTIWTWTQSLWAFNVQIHMDWCILFTKYVMLVYIMYEILTEKDLFDKFLWVHVIGCFMFGWVLFTTSFHGRVEGVGGPGVEDSNTMGMHLSTGLVIAGVLFLSGGWGRWIALFTIPFILNGIILGSSRGATLGLVCAGLVLPILIPAKRRGTLLVGFLLGIVAMGILAHDQYWERLSTLWGGKKYEIGEHKEATVGGRLEIIQGQWRIFFDHPLGTGFRGTMGYSREYMPPELLDKDIGKRASHNTIMSIVVDQGIPGILMVIGLVSWAVINLLRLRSWDSRGLPLLLGCYRAGIGGGLASYFAAGLTSNYLKSEVGIWLICLLAVLICLSRKSCESSVLSKEQPSKSRIQNREWRQVAAG